MTLLFGGWIETISSISILGMLVFIGITIAKYKSIDKWGRRIGAFMVWGLLVCIFVATRDGYGFSSIPVIAMDSIQSTLCCIGGGLLALLSISSIFIKKQRYRKFCFFALSCVFIAKMFVIEAYRFTTLL